MEAARTGSLPSTQHVPSPAPTPPQGHEEPPLGREVLKIPVSAQEGQGGTQTRVTGLDNTRRRKTGEQDSPQMRSIPRPRKSFRGGQFPSKMVPGPGAFQARPPSAHTHLAADHTGLGPPVLGTCCTFFGLHPPGPRAEVPDTSALSHHPGAEVRVPPALLCLNHSPS